MEDLEAVIIARPLWSYADIPVGCLDAGCKKMMAKSEAVCLRIIEAAKRNNRLLKIRTAGLTSQRQLAAQKRTACARFQSELFGVRRLGTSGELAALQTIFRRTDRRTGQPFDYGDELVFLKSTDCCLWDGQHCAPQRRARSLRSRLRHAGISERKRRDVFFN